MKFTSRPMAGVAGVLVVMCAVATAHAQDQPRPTIPPEMYQLDGPFSGDQQKTVETYVDFYVKQLVDGTEEQIVEARSELASPLQKGGTQTFNEQYSAVASAKLDASSAMNAAPPAPANADNNEQNGSDQGESPKDELEVARQVVVRLNAMVVCWHLIKDDHVVNLILQGIADSNPAVRYWAVRAVRGGDSAMSYEQKQKLVAALSKQVNVENVDEVVRQLLLALIELDAVDQVQQALNELIKQHIGNPKLTYDAKREAMRSLLQKIQVMLANGQPVEPQFRQLARAASRYMALITQQDQGAGLDEETERDAIEMVKLCDMVLRQAHAAFKSTVAAPPSIDAAAFGKNWPALQAAALQWREVLTKPPFNFADDDLSPAGR